MSFFPLPHTAKLYKKVGAPTRNRAGQIEVGDDHESTPVNIPNCLYYGFSGGRSTQAREDYSQTASFYLPPGSSVSEGDLITDIRGIDSFEPGPFLVEKVTYVTSFGGQVHHISCKLRGVTG